MVTIVKVENGWIVEKDSLTYVADDMYGLKQLVGDLCTRTEEEEVVA